MFDNAKRDGIESCAPEDCASCSADCGSKLDLTKPYIVVTTDEGQKIGCKVMLKYQMDDRDYIAVMPVLDNPDGDIYLFRIVDGGTNLDNIEDETEYADAARTFGIEMDKHERAKQKQ